MRLNPLRHSLLIILTLLAVVPAFSWHDEGHKLTGYIAWQRMTPQTRANLVRILRAAPEDSDIAAFYQVWGIQSTQAREMDFFVIIPTWADMVRERSFPVRYRKYHHSNWHYDDTFWREVNGKVELVPMTEDGGQAVTQLASAEKTMRDPKASDVDKAVAIAWFLHLAGDIHQPLHNSARVTSTEPKGDQGGNLFFLEPETKPGVARLNLHSFWDGIPARAVPLKNGQCVEDYVASLGNEMVKKHPFGEFAGALKLGNYEAWHQEGLSLATTIVFTPDLKRSEMPSKKYQKAAFATAERQIALAGYRIAETLNSIFGTIAPASSPN
ncbi:MAG: S1/P1 nuclease [Pyrinomonadaceae bacterium]